MQQTTWDRKEGLKEKANNRENGKGKK